MLYDLIVVGCGTMGVATALEAARRGAVVLAIDQFGVPNTRGEHHGDARMVRTAYYEHPDYVPLLRHAFDAWRALETDAGEKLFHVTGAVYLGPPRGELVPRSLAAARAHGLAFEELDAAQVSRRWPALGVPPGSVAMFEPAAGVVVPQLAVRVMARLARDAGATIGTDERVLRVGAGRDGVEVRTDRGVYRGRAAVVTAGPWSSRLLADSRIHSPTLTVTRQSLGWTRPADPASYTPDRFPCWAWEDAPGSLHYGFPILGDGLMRVARHRRGPVTDPDADDRAPMPADADEYMPGVRAVVPGCGPLAREGVCLYTNSADGHFILDRASLDGSPNAPIWLACGFSGHGFKFAPVVGHIMADLALTGRTDHRIEFLASSRLGGTSR